MDEGNVNDHIPIANNVGVLDDKIAATEASLTTLTILHPKTDIGLAVVLAHRGDDGALCVQARVMTDLLQRI